MCLTHKEVLIDICIIDTDTHVSSTPETVLESAAIEKKGFIREQLKIVVVILHPL